MATLLAYTGKFQEADHEIRLAQELDPLSFTLHATAFYVNLSLRRWDQAHKVSQQIAELVPAGTTHVYYSGLVFVLQGDCKSALAALANVKPLALEPGSRELGEEHLHRLAPEHAFSPNADR